MIYIHYYYLPVSLVPSINLLNCSSFTMTDALRPVPKLEGHVPRKPNLSFHINLVPLLSADTWRAFDKSQKRRNTDTISPPFSTTKIHKQKIYIIPLPVNTNHYYFYLLTWNNATMVLLIHPSQSSLILVMEDTSVIRPYAGGSSSSQKVASCRNLKQETPRGQEAPALFTQLTELVVSTGEIPCESTE